MKKNVSIVCSFLAIISLMACKSEAGNISEENESLIAESKDLASNTIATVENKPKTFADFIYDIGPRFNHITKEDLDDLKSFTDIIGEEHASRIVDYKSMSVIILEGDQQTDKRVNGNDGVFTEAQIEFLQSLDYSTNLMIWADYTETNSETGKLEEQHWTPHLTVVPEKQASYFEGRDALIKYLQVNTEEIRKNVDPEKLLPAKLYFTVAKNGNIENVHLDRPSGYPDVDEKMIQLINKTQGDWELAENTKGENVNQEFVVSFGLLGC